MAIIANFKKWLKAMRGGSQARSHEEAAKRVGPYAAENKAKDDAAKARTKPQPAEDNDTKVGPG